MAVKPKAKAKAKAKPANRGPGRPKIFDRKTKYGQGKIAEAIRIAGATGGTDAIIANIMGITRQTLQNAMKADEDFRSAITESRGRVKESSIGCVIRNANKGNQRAAEYLLENITETVKDEHGHEPVTIIFKRGGAAVSDGD